MPASREFRGRRAATVENDHLRLTVLEEGGHIAEIFDKRSGINPLWTPPWASIEPSTYVHARHRQYGNGSDAKLLAGIMGHNLCVDIFGGPSDAEAAAGLTPHGEASVVPYELTITCNTMTAATALPLAGLRIERDIALVDRTVTIRERIDNLSARRFTDVSPLSGYTAHLMSAAQEHAFFVAFSPTARLAFGYVWRRDDFPWLGIWRENRSRPDAPWNGATLACGMEFGASPMPESRREMINRGRLFDVPTFRWIPAKSRVEVAYCAIVRDADVVPETLDSATT
jgi:hypothetical protein